jgi:hypothetical protein
MSAGHHGGHGHGHDGKKLEAILILALAALLAITEMAGKSAQTVALNENVAASDLWNFYQAKTIRGTVISASAQDAETRLAAPDALPPAVAEATRKQVADWRAYAAKLDSDPEKREGRKELMQRAREKEEIRDHALHSYHLYEYASAALQIAIVMASVATLMELGIFTLVAGGLGAVGVAFGLLGWLAPNLIHL